MTERYSRWEDAMIAQIELLRFSHSDYGVAYLREFFMEMNAKYPAADRIATEFLTAVQQLTLRDAEPIYVAHEACDLIDFARKTFDPEACHPSDPFCPRGFALFAKPLVVEDMPVTEQAPMRSALGTIPIRAMAWTSVHNEDLTQGTFWISFYVCVADERALADATGVPDRWVTDDGNDMFDAMMRRMPLSLMHQYQWTWGTNPCYDSPESLPVMEGDKLTDVVERGRQQTAFVQAFWRLASQFYPAKERAPRGLWRDANRKGILTKDVTVVRLRRSREGYEPSEATGRALRVQFPVRGYWARRHTREGTRQVWVRPHMKGDPDAPLQLTDRVWEFNR